MFELRLETTKTTDKNNLYLVSDMLRAIKLLDSDDSFIRTFAPLVLSLISGIPQPEKMDEGDVKNFWANELEKMKAKSKWRKSMK